MLPWKKAYQANCWGVLGGEPVGVTSVKDLFYRTFGDMNRAIAEIGQAGYQAIELFDGNLVEYEGKSSELRQPAQRCRVEHAGCLQRRKLYLPGGLAGRAMAHQEGSGPCCEMGAEHLVVGGGAKRTVPATDEDYARLAAALDQVADLAEERGLLAHYHPHLTTMAEAPEQVRKVFASSRICFCPDTAHLFAGGGDPAKLILEHASRIKYVHLKDFRRDPFAFLPLGEGELDMNAILQALITIKYAGWIAVELDAYDDPKAGAEISMRYLTEFEKRTQIQ